MSEPLRKPRSPRGRIAARRLPLFAGLVAFVLVAIIVMRLQPQAAPDVVSAPLTVAGAADAPAAAGAPAVPPVQLTGQIALDDFRIVVPQGWQRRTDLEDQGPGTKLFLAGPTVGAGQVFIGIDVYTLPRGMSLQDFIKRYSARWVGLGVIADKPSSLCGKPARMLQLSDGKVDKLFLVTVRGDRGFVIGMFGPANQSGDNVKAFKGVVDSFQFYG